MPIDAQRFPRLSAHVKALPEGLESHPGCEAKGTLLRTFAAEVRAGSVREAGLPARLEALLLEPPSSSAWVPEALSWAGIYAAADLAGLADDAAYERWAHQRNWELHRSPAMRAAMTFSSPNLALVLGPSYWAVLHQGSNLQVLDAQRQSAQVALTYPEQLFGAAAARSLCLSFAVVLELAKARHPVVRVDDWTPTRAVFGARWT